MKFRIVCKTMSSFNGLVSSVYCVQHRGFLSSTWQNIRCWYTSEFEDMPGYFTEHLPSLSIAQRILAACEANPKKAVREGIGQDDEEIVK